MKHLFTFLFVFTLTLVTFSSLAQNKNIAVQTTQTINAPVEEVYDLLRSFERFPEWSPFVVTDPEQKNQVTGTDGDVGAVFHWEGVAEKSLGTQTLSELKTNRYLLMNCDIQKPQKSKGVFEYTLSEENGQTVVVQNFSIPCNGFQKFMMNLFGVQKHISEINTLGMDRLKALAEKESALSQK